MGGTAKGNLVRVAAHLTISYLVPGAGAPALCGQWSVTSSAFVPQPGYTQATCVVTGNLVQVEAIYVYRFITPMLRAAHGTVTIATQSEAMVEVSPP